MAHLLTLANRAYSVLTPANEPPARALEKTRLIRVSGELIKNTLAHQSKLVAQLEKIGAEQQEIKREDRKIQLLLRLSRSRTSVSLQVSRFSDKFSSLLLGVDINRHVIQFDEVMSQHRNPIRVGDTVAVTGSITGTPIVFKTRVLALKVVDGSTLYECSIPDEMTYEPVSYTHLTLPRICSV